MCLAGYPKEVGLMVLRTVFPTVSGVSELLSNYKVRDIILTFLLHQHMLIEQ